MRTQVGFSVRSVSRLTIDNVKENMDPRSRQGAPYSAMKRGCSAVSTWGCAMPNNG